MKKNVFWRLLIIGITVLVSVVFFLPNTPLFRSMPQWWQKNMPSKGIVLGLDLQGGIHLVFEVEGDKAVEAAVDRYAKLIRDLAQKKKIETTVKRRDLNIEITPFSTEISDAVKESFPNLETVSAGETLALTLSSREVNSIKDDASNQAIETIRNRIDEFGVAEPTIQRQGDNEVVVQLPGVKDPRRAIDLIGRTALLE